MQKKFCWAKTYNMKQYLKFIPLIFLAACINVTNDSEKGVEVKVSTSSNQKIRNNIVIEEHGLKVEQAFLLFDDNSLVSEANETNINKKIKCRLILSGGWKEKDGKVFPGASEIIETNTGKLVLDEKDLFAEYDSTGVAAEDASYITLSANITKIDKLYDYFVVKFKVWDKVGSGYVDGSFKFTIK